MSVFVVDPIDGGNLPLYDKSPGERYVLLGEDGTVAVKCDRETRVTVPILSPSAESFKAIAKAVEIAETESCYSFILVTSKM